MQHPYSLITPERVLDLVESTGLITDARQLVLNSYENRVYQVGIEDAQPVVMKVYRPERWTDAAILEEHRFSQALLDAELSVVAPLSLQGITLHQATLNPQEATLEETGLEEPVCFRFALFPRQGGHAPELDQEETLLILGRTLARMHNLGALMPFEHRSSISIERMGVDCRRFLLEGNWIPTELIPAYESLTQELLDIIQSRWPKKLCSIRLHGDCHPGNILWRDGPHFVDLDDAMMGPEVQDLWMLIPGDDQQKQSAWQILLEGYSEFRDFDLSQLNLIEPLRTLRIIHYSAWLARRWQDPAFKMAFPWFNSVRYWSEHILSLREQRAALDEAPPKIWL
jgi:Ser/Thr protein kinase RdoA (MazF antagonist)